VKIQYDHTHITEDKNFTSKYKNMKLTNTRALTHRPY